MGWMVWQPAFVQLLPCSSPGTVTASDKPLSHFSRWPLPAHCSGFLPFNFAPAKIFLGTTGAYFLGYQIATLSILSPAKLSTALLVLAVPILDVAWQIVDRLRRGQNPLQGDRGHLHFRLSDGGLPTRWIVIGYYIVAISFGLVAIASPSGLFKLLFWLALCAAVFALLIWLSRRQEFPTLDMLNPLHSCIMLGSGL